MTADYARSVVAATLKTRPKVYIMSLDTLLVLNNFKLKDVGMARSFFPHHLVDRYPFAQIILGKWSGRLLMGQVVLTYPIGFGGSKIFRTR